MGQKASTPVIENVSVHITQDLLRQLSEDPAKFTLPQSAEELNQLIDHQVEKKYFEKYTHEQRTTSILSKEVNHILDRYQRPMPIHGNPELKEMEQKVIECYRKQPNRALDCYAEVEDFKSMVQKAQTVTQSSLSFE